jgi:Cft2 family RNA processing exonuclease
MLDVSCVEARIAGFVGGWQELCILLDEYWERTNLKVPIYFSAGMSVKWVIVSGRQNGYALVLSLP